MKREIVVFGFKYWVARLNRSNWAYNSATPGMEILDFLEEGGRIRNKIDKSFTLSRRR